LPQEPLPQEPLPPLLPLPPEPLPPLLPLPPEPLPPPPPPACLDADFDTICDDVDFCLGTHIPEAAPYNRLLPNHFALCDDNLIFDAVQRGSGPLRIYTIFDTAGCNCEQILDRLGGRYQYNDGCSALTMETWIRIVYDHGWILP
jgi:hypothetical protein